MNEKYYYVRDGKNRPIITVCLAQSVNGRIGRGVAICSDKDQPCKKIGRAIAKTRAIYALNTQCNCCKINRWEFLTIAIHSQIWLITKHKSIYNPKLTEYEQKLFGNNKEKTA